MRQRASRISRITFLLVLAAAAFLYLRQRTEYRGPVVVERQVSGSSRGVAPVPEFLLRHAKELGLTAAQRRQIEGVADAYRRDIAPVAAKLNAAAEQYQAYLQRARAQVTSARKLAEQGENVQRLSSVVATARRSYWEQVEKMLTPAQKAAVRKLLEKASANDFR